MKKVLLASTALVLSAGVAAAEVSVSGSAGIWLQDDGVNDVMVNYDISIDFSASGETDGGLTMGMDYTLLEGGSACTDAACASTGTFADVDNAEVYISGAFGKLTVGDVDDALQKVAGIGDIGYDGIGVDNVAESARGDGSADGVLYQYNAGDFGLYLSHHMDTSDDDMAIGVSAAFGDFKIGIGYEDQKSIGDKLTAVDLSGSFGDVSFDAYYESADVNGDGYGIILSMGFGATSVSLGYADHDNATDAAVGLGISYDLGGASLDAGVGDVGGNTVWDLGVSMSF